MITFIIIGVTVLVSYLSFQNRTMWSALLFDPYLIKEKQEHWRFVTHGFIHADFQHLLFNMLTLYFFGRNIERVFMSLFGNEWVYPIFYLSALVVASAPDFWKHRNNYHYRSLGASGAVAAVLFTTILFDPWQVLMLNFIIPVPAILFAVGYIWYSNYMNKKGNDNIGHNAHMYGALYGFLFPLVLKPSILPYFLNQLLHPRFL